MFSKTSVEMSGFSWGVLDPNPKYDFQNVSTNILDHDSRHSAQACLRHTSHWKDKVCVVLGVLESVRTQVFNQVCTHGLGFEVLGLG